MMRYVHIVQAGIFIKQRLLHSREPAPWPLLVIPVYTELAGKVCIDKSNIVYAVKKLKDKIEKGYYIAGVDCEALTNAFKAREEYHVRTKSKAELKKM